MTYTVHPNAVVHPEAQIGAGSTIGPFCVLGPSVKLGENNVLHSHVVMSGHLQVEDKNTFYPFSSIGAEPQDLTYKGEPTRVTIGSGNTFREYVSVHRGTLKQEGLTQIGNNSLFMAYVHLGHDMQVGDHVTLVNAVNCAGHVKIHDRVIVGGNTAISQFITIGRGAYIGGGSGVDRDIPPYCTGYGNRIHLKGINIIGLRRQGYSKAEVSEAVDFYRTMEASSLSPRAFIEHHANEYAGNQVIKEIMEAIAASEVGIASFV